MKKVTFLLIALLCAVVTFAAGPKKQFTPLPFAPKQASVQMGKQFNAKQAPAGLAKQALKGAKAKARAPKKAITAADLVGDYQWDFEQASETSTDLESLTTTAGSAHVTIALGEAEPTEFEATFDFNEMDVPTSTNATNDGDITQEETLTEGGVALTISPKDEGVSSPNRFWSTTAGPQLRVYSGTLTFEVPEGFVMTQIVFNHNGKWGANTVGEDAIANDAEAKVATWTGEAKQVVVAIAANSQINSIEVAYSVEGAEEAVGEPIVISGMFTKDLKGTLYNDEDGDYFVIDGGQLAGTSSYGDYVLYGLFYYEGDEQYEAGWYYDDIYGIVNVEVGTISIYPWLCRVLSGGQYDGYSLTPYYVEGSTFTPVEPLTVVELPEGVEADEYSMFYEDENGDTGAVTVHVAVDGNDVYVQGFSYYIPEAWVKGTKDGNTVTFPEMQYVGEYYDYESYAFYNGEAVFTYDAEADTYTAEGEIFGVLGDQYYDGHYFNPVIKKVVEKAVMPADPSITALTNGQYGWYFNFNVPVVDVNGEGLSTSKLSYMIYTDIEGEIAPLTFTPATHTYLTEDLTEIPYGFTEQYDFYDTQIYLNGLYSADWNNLGIQSIYYGGGETNSTEIQWYHIKDYTVSENLGVTFNFNAMDEATSSNESTDGDITSERFIVDEVSGTVLYISPKTEDATTENRFWDTTAGPQLRMYSGALGITAPSGYNITKVVFNYAKWNDGNTPEHGELVNDANAKAATWTSDYAVGRMSVYLTIAGNTQINSIDVTLKAEGSEVSEAIDPDGITYTFDDGLLGDWTTIDADGDGYTWMNTSATSNALIAHNGSDNAVFSQSYDNNVGPLTPDNYLVSPKVKLGSEFSFYAVAQDASYPAEHFGVFVSTTGKKVEDFEMVDEWTLTAARGNGAKFNAPGVFRGPKKVQGNWYKYTVDMSAYEGQEGYVAIRHFDCTDNFYIIVDDISFGKPEYEIVPEEGVVESLGEFTITFNKYDVVLTADAGATLTNTSGTVQTTTVAVENNTLTINFEETTEPGKYTLIVTGVTNADNEPIDLSFNYTIEEPDVLVELPEGVTPIEYTLTAAGATSQSDIDIEDTKLVAFDGTDVYLQGLAYYFPDAYVKGELTADNQIVVPSGRFVGEDEYGVEYIVALGVDEEGYFIDAENIVFDYDAESGVISLAEGSYYGESSTKDSQSLWDYFEEATYTPGAYVLPDVVEAPEGLETETWYLAAKDSDDKAVRANEVQIGIDGTDMYIQGICTYLPEAWVKGTIDQENQTVTFASGQFYGVYNDQYRLFFVGYDSDTEDIADVVFTLDKENNVMTTDQWIVLNGKQDEFSVYDYYYDVVISKEKPEVPEAIVAPEDLVTEAYQFKGYDTYYKEDVTGEVQVGFYGENQVYIQGLSGYVEDAWVVGTLEGNTLTIPETYLGIYESWFGDSEVFFSGATFVYDSEAQTFTSEDGFVSYETPEDEYWMDEYSNVVLTKLNDVAATPADPEITDFVGTGSLPKVKFNIPLEDVDGNPLLSSKVAYQFFIDKGEGEEALVLTTDLYKELDEDMSEIPYTFSDDWDIYNDHIYLNQSEEELQSWKKLGLQSIYYGGGETNKSNIVWFNVEEYWEVVTGIAGVKADNQQTVIFDLQGRRIDKPGKGLYIVNGKKVVLK